MNYSRCLTFLCNGSAIDWDRSSTPTNQGRYSCFMGVIFIIYIERFSKAKAQLL